MHLVCFQGRLCFSCLVSSSSASSHSPSLVLLQRTLIKHKCMSLTSRHFLDSFRYSVKIWNRLFLLLLLFSKKKTILQPFPFSSPISPCSLPWIQITSYINSMSISENPGKSKEIQRIYKSCKYYKQTSILSKPKRYSSSPQEQSRQLHQLHLLHL